MWASRWALESLKAQLIALETTSTAAVLLGWSATMNAQDRIATTLQTIARPVRLTGRQLAADDVFEL